MEAKWAFGIFEVRKFFSNSLATPIFIALEKMESNQTPLGNICGTVYTIFALISLLQQQCIRVGCVCDTSAYHNQGLPKDP